MFAVIRVSKKWSVKSIRVQLVKQSDVKYYVFFVRNGNKIKWHKLSKMLGDLRSRVIFGDGISEPVDGCVKKAGCDRYYHKLAMNALRQILVANKDYVKEKSVLLVDIQCKYQGYADILVEYFKQVHIVTNKVDFYNNYSDSKLYDCGAAINIATRLSKLADDCSLSVSPSGIVLQYMEGVGVPIFSALPVNSSVGAYVYHSFYEHNEVACHNMEGLSCANDEEFGEAVLGALYEYCGMRSLGKNADGGYINKEKVDLEQIKVNIFSLDKNELNLYNG